MASLTNCWPTVRFRLRAIRERWVPVVRFWRTVRFLLRAIRARWVQAVRLCRSDLHRSFRSLVILPGDRLYALEPGNVT